MENNLNMSNDIFRVNSEKLELIVQELVNLVNQCKERGYVTTNQSTQMYSCQTKLENVVKSCQVSFKTNAPDELLKKIGEAYYNIHLIKHSIDHIR